MSATRFLTRADAALRLHISLRTLKRLMDARAIAYYREGNRVWFTEEQLAEYETNRRRRLVLVPARAVQRKTRRAS